MTWDEKPGVNRQDSLHIFNSHFFKKLTEDRLHNFQVLYARVVAALPSASKSLACLV